MMKKLNLKNICLISLASLLSINVAQAAPCNGFQIQIKNNTPDDLIVSRIRLTGASLEPGGIQLVKAHSEQAFTVNGSQNNVKMKGNLEFHSFSLPSKTTSIDFQLKNMALVCQHDDHHSKSPYGINKTRLPGKVAYTIG